MFNDLKELDGGYTLVFSPDDGGYYLKQWDLDNRRTRVSKRVWRNSTEAERSLKLGTVKWERWH
jgi:hypothetical protein